MMLFNFLHIKNKFYKTKKTAIIGLETKTSIKLVGNINSGAGIEFYRRGFLEKLRIYYLVQWSLYVDSLL